MPSDEASTFRLQREVDPKRDHVRGGGGEDVVTVVSYGDFLCPYCRRLIPVLARLREALGDRLVHVFRHFPNERAHPGAELVARATEAAAQQGQFWQMHDRVYGREPPITERVLLDFARELGLDLPRFSADMRGDEARKSVEEDLEDGRANGVTGTPTLFVDGVRYDGAWDFYSLLEALERPVAARVQRAGRVFASLPASGGLVLLLAAAAAVACANSPLGARYRSLIASPLVLGSHQWLSMSVGEWCSEGLLAVFFLLVGLEIRREMTAGALTDFRAAVLPVVAAVGGVIAPALLYLALNRGTPGAQGWSIPTATDVAFTLGILALLGEKVPAGLRVFVAALAVVDDVLSVLILAFFFPRSLTVTWLAGSVLASVVLLGLNRSRVYATWPYAVVTVVLWFTLHRAGVHGALAGVLLATFLPTRPAPAAAPLLAQAATALAALEHAERELKERQKTPADNGEELRLDEEPVWDWASRNLSAASERLLSPADRIERMLAPWSTYVVLPLFAFSATGVKLDVDLSTDGAPRILEGVVLGLVIGKPLGISLASWLAIKSGAALAPGGVSVRQFLGGACLCGVADTVALLMADQASLPSATAAVAKIGCLIGSFIAAALGTLVLVTRSRGTGAPEIRKIPPRSNAADGLVSSRPMTSTSAKRRSLVWRLIVCALFGLLAASIAGCTGMTFVVQQYEGPPRPKETVAVIRANGGTGPELVSVDGQPLQVMLEKGNRLHVEVLPGTHEVELAAPEMGLNRAIPVYFVAEPGKVYRFEVRSLETATTVLSDPAGKAFAYEVDRKSDAPLRLAARPPERAPPLAPAHETALPPDSDTVEAGADASGGE